MKQEVVKSFVNITNFANFGHKLHQAVVTISESFSEMKT